MLKLVTSLLFFAACCFGDATYTVGAGQAYSTHALALAAVPTNLSGEGLQLIAPIAGTYTESVHITGFTNASATNKIRIKPQAGNDHGGIFSSATAVIITHTVNPSLRMSTAFAEAIGLQLQGTQSGGTGMQIAFDAADVTVQNCLISRNSILSAGEYAISYFSYSPGAKIISTIIHNTNNSNGAYGVYGDGATWLVLNCTIINFKFGVRGAVTKNTVAYHNDAASKQDFYTPQVAGSTNNASRDATAATGSGNLINQSLIGVAPVSSPNDFHIGSTSTLIGSGFDNSAVFTTDIDNQTWSTWGKGADFFFVAPTATGNSGRSRGQGRGRLRGR